MTEKLRGIFWLTLYNDHVTVVDDYKAIRWPRVIQAKVFSDKVKAKAKAEA